HGCRIASVRTIAPAAVSAPPRGKPRPARASSSPDRRRLLVVRVRHLIPLVVPAKAGTHLSAARSVELWIPASAGMTAIVLQNVRIHLLAPHRRGAVEAGLERVERDVGPARRVHELFPAHVE